MIRNLLWLGIKNPWKRGYATWSFQDYNSIFIKSELKSCLVKTFAFSLSGPVTTDRELSWIRLMETQRISPLHCPCDREFRLVGQAIDFPSAFCKCRSGECVHTYSMQIFWLFLSRRCCQGVFIKRVQNGPPPDGRCFYRLARAST